MILDSKGLCPSGFRLHLEGDLGFWVGEDSKVVSLCHSWASWWWGGAFRGAGCREEKVR